MLDVSKKCNKCKVNKHITQFHRRTISPDGYDASCKECRKRMVYQRSNIGDAPDRDKIPAMEILRLLGYELNNPNNSVYVQFKERMSKKGVDITGW